MKTILRSHFWIPAGLALVLAAVNFSVWQKEQLLASGKTVFLELAPVDPRSLMQGDYMRLDYALTRALREPREQRQPREPQEQRKTTDRDQPGSVTRIVRLVLDPRGVATRLAAESDAPLAADEARMVLRQRGAGFDRSWRIGSDAYFFQEGTDHIFTQAKYGEYRAGADGESVLVALRDEKFVRLGVSRLEHRWQVPAGLPALRHRVAPKS